MNVAVTGATGHIGGHLVRALLEAGHRVRVLHREDQRNLDGLDLEWVPGELADRAALDRAVGGVELAFHLAGRISIRSRDDAELTRTNVEGVRAIVDACRRSRVRRLVHFSSIHAFLAGPPSEVIDERGPDSDVPGADPYDRSKARGQKVILEAVQAGLDAVIVNPTGVIGPLDFKPSRMGSVLDDLRRGRMPGLIQGGFNWVDARDVARSALRAAEVGRTGEKYILGGEWRSIAEMAAFVAEASGRRAPWFVCPLPLAKAFAPVAERIADLRKVEPAYTGPAVNALRNHRRISIDKARKELGHAPRPISESVRDTVTWFASRASAATGKGPAPERASEGTR